MQELEGTVRSRRVWIRSWPGWQGQGGVAVAARAWQRHGSVLSSTMASLIGDYYYYYCYYYYYYY